MNEGSGFLKLNLNDFIRGAITAVISAVVFAVIKVVQDVFGAPGFNVFAVDWGGTFVNCVNVAVTAAYYAFVGYIGKSTLTDTNGDIHLGIATIKR